MLPGYNKYDLFCKAATTEYKDENNPVQQSSNLVTDDEEELTLQTQEINLERTWETTFQNVPKCIPVTEDDSSESPEKTVPPSVSKHEQIQDQPQSITFETESPNLCLPTQEQEEEDISSGSDAALLLRCHYKYGHISFQKLKRMAQQGVIPCRLKDTYKPSCLACEYAKATCKPWKNKKQKGYKRPIKATKPGQVVSVDQLVSPTPGLIAQMTGILTTKRYRYATVYVNQFSKFSYFHL